MTGPSFTKTAETLSSSTSSCCLTGLQIPEAIGADEVWMWALYPELDAAYGPFLLPRVIHAHLPHL